MVRPSNNTKDQLFTTRSEKEFLCQREGILLGLVVWETIQLQVQQISQLKFKHYLKNFLTSRTLLFALPPLQDIQHHVDFVPGSTISHLLHYNTSPKEYGILHEQVQDLLQKQHIQPSLSPCVMCYPCFINTKEGWQLESVDSKAINKIIIKYHFPIPQIDDLFD